MLCPEVWNFKPPQHHFDTEKINYKKTGVPATVSKHYFNHVVSLTLPDTNDIPNHLSNCILEDSDYYRIKDLRISDLLNKQFIDSFIKKGELTLLTVGHKIDLCNSIAILPSGILTISLISEDFQKLGLEGNKSFFDRKTNTRNVVTIDLTAKTFIPGKKNYELAKTTLEKRLNQNFDVILTWEPPEEGLCPSSVASWFYEHGYSVSLCQQKVSIKTVDYVNIPIITDGFNTTDFFEWLGVFCISGNTTNEEAAEYVNTYECPKPNVFVKKVQYIQCTGFFTRKRLIRIYDAIKEYVSLQNNLPWCSLNIQGFSDSPISWDIKEHTYFIDGDNSYSILFCPNNECVIQKSLSSNNKPRTFL